MKKNILLLCGGGGTEHDVSLVSASYIEKVLKKNKDFNVIHVELTKKGPWKDKANETVELTINRDLIFPHEEATISFAIPCIHGFPGETGDIQSYFEMINLPYLGCDSEASKLCFNKVSTKLWLSALGINNTPFTFLNSIENYDQAEKFFNEHGDVFVKAASQGSSIGCYHVTKVEDLKSKILEAFKFSTNVLIEKTVKGRELEISTYEFNGELQVTNPGEILPPENDFYSFEEKYSEASHSKTVIEAVDLSETTKEQMKSMAYRAFKGLNLKHLARIDFFMTKNGDIYLNEINTFPGMTPISMFPKMMENKGDLFETFIKSIIEKESK